MKQAIQAPNMQQWTCIAPSGAQRTRFQEIPHYAEGLYDLHHQLYAWMVPNGSWGEANAGLIMGEGESLLVDTLYDLKYTQTMLDAMRPLTQRTPLRYVVNTHADGDHFWGNELVSECEIITSQSSFHEMKFVAPKFEIWMRRIGKPLSWLRPLPIAKGGHWFYNMVAPYDFQTVTPTLPTRTFETSLTLEVGGREVQLIKVGPAHTHGDLIVYVPDAKTVFSGDVLFIGSTPVMWAGPVENWLAALDTIQSLDVETIVPGHGPVTDLAGLAEVRGYWLYLQREVRRCIAAGMSSKEAAYAILLSPDYAEQPFACWNSPERIRTNTHVMYGHMTGRTEQTTIAGWMRILWEQALLAHELPNAQPAIMRQKLRLTH